jgi:hypothetical protein
MAHALQRAQSGKLKSPHLDYSPDRECRIKETASSSAMLKPQDILAILKVHSWDSTNWTYSSRSKRGPERIASVHAALERSEAAGLYYGSERKILKQAVLEFLVHGLRYVFYAQPGPLSRGLPTAHSAEPLKSKLVVSPSEVYVWPDPGWCRERAGNRASVPFSPPSCQ